MLTKPSREETYALAVTSRTPHGETILSYLDRMVADVDVKLRNADVPFIYRLQGRSEALTEFVELFRDAVRLVNEADNRAKSR